MRENGRLDVILKRFDSPDEVREMVKGRFEIVRLGGVPPRVVAAVGASLT
jgi:hypothetical protein